MRDLSPSSGVDKTKKSENINTTSQGKGSSPSMKDILKSPSYGSGQENCKKFQELYFARDDSKDNSTRSIVKKDVQTSPMTSNSLSPTVSNLSLSGSLSIVKDANRRNNSEN